MNPKQSENKVNPDAERDFFKIIEDCSDVEVAL